MQVTLRNEEEKKKITVLVHKIGQNDFRITEDFSKKERKTINEWYQKAKEKTRRERRMLRMESERYSSG